jgi:hypothetical protein
VLSEDRDYLSLLEPPEDGWISEDAKMTPNQTSASRRSTISIDTTPINRAREGRKHGMSSGTIVEDQGSGADLEADIDELLEEDVRPLCEVLMEPKQVEMVNFDVDSDDEMHSVEEVHRVVQALHREELDSVKEVDSVKVDILKEVDSLKELHGEKEVQGGEEVHREEAEHGPACDCLDCDDVDFLHGFVDGEPFGIK